MYCQPLLTSQVLLSGKTRWGREFFKSVQNWKSPSVDDPENLKKELLLEPVFLYLILDFVNVVRLNKLDKNLDATIILGLRIAYDCFVRNKMIFEAFQYQTYTHHNPTY